jgi:hypothetical protein
VDPKPSGLRVLLAPSFGDGGGSSRQAPGSEGPRGTVPARPYPRVDQHVVGVEVREEMVRGRRVHAMPANPPHGDRHFQLDYVIAAHVKEGYVGSTDLLTRASEGSDFATDTCVRRAGVDPATGARHLEELAFEVVNEQSLQDVTDRAADLTARGVRRVVAVFVKTGEVCEWSAGAWQRIDKDGTFTDPVLARPLRVRDLLDAAGADDAVARALLAKHNRVLAEAQAEAETRALREGIEAACELCGIPLDGERRAWLARQDAAALREKMGTIRNERRW